MPDAHQGYGLPIGGVLATENAVIPYAVGVDIACRMRMSIFGVEDAENVLASPVRERLRAALESETRFGMGAKFDGGQRRDHPVLEEDWRVTQVTARLKDLAWTQLGTSGTGNHFVEFGLLRLDRPAAGVEPGSYLALLSHSGSRGTGAAVASHYSKLAEELHPDLPKELRNLAWLSLDLAEGQEYWQAMNLMGGYAAANHERIHHHVAQALGFEVLAVVENHHNFAWKEEHDGRELIVHRKGATRAFPRRTPPTTRHGRQHATLGRQRRRSLVRGPDLHPLLALRRPRAAKLPREQGRRRRLSRHAERDGCLHTHGQQRTSYPLLGDHRPGNANQSQQSFFLQSRRLGDDSGSYSDPKRGPIHACGSNFDSDWRNHCGQGQWT
jgi:hypothetical protein